MKRCTTKNVLTVLENFISYTNDGLLMMVLLIAC